MTAPQPASETLDLGTLSGSLGLLVRLAQTRIYDLFFAAFSGEDIRPGAITVLWVIDLNPNVRQGEVARALNIKPAHMTKLVQRLVSDGLIIRHIPPEDRRSVRLALTPAGRMHLDPLRERFLNVHASENTGLTPSETEQLKHLLRKLAFPKDRP